MDRATVVAKCHTARLNELGHLGKGFTGTMKRNCTDWLNFYGPLPLRNLLHLMYQSGTVVRRLCVWHRANGCEATMCRRLGCCRNRLLMLLTRFAQVCVEVNKSWGNHCTARVDDL